MTEPERATLREVSEIREAVAGLTADGKSRGEQLTLLTADVRSLRDDIAELRGHLAELRTLVAQAQAVWRVGRIVTTAAGAVIAAGITWIIALKKD